MRDSVSSRNYDCSVSAVGVIMEHALAILPRSPLRGKESRAHRVTYGWRPRQGSKRSQEPQILLDF